MTPEEAMTQQIERYRAMTGEQRLKIALDMHESECNALRSEIRLRHSDATDEEIEQLLRKRLELERSLRDDFGGG